MSSPDAPARTRLLIDAGQTSSRIRILSDTDPSDFLSSAASSAAQHATAAEHTGPPVYTDRPVVAQLIELLRPHLDDNLAADPVRIAVYAGISGLTDDAADGIDSLADALSRWAVTEVALAHDSVTGYLAANGTGPGVVCAAGTGVVTLGVGSRVARVDGWGHLLGDAGSGYWIGRAGLDAALRSFDGRTAPSILEQAASREFGPLAEVYMTLQADTERVRRIAAFAQSVAEAADAGDTVARSIRSTAAQELSESVRAAAHRSGLVGLSADRHAGICVSAIGSVLTRDDTLRAEFAQALATRVPDAVVGAPFGAPLDGVGLLGSVEADHPLASAIRRVCIND